MELYLQSLYGLLYTAVLLIGSDPETPPPLTLHLGSYTRALLVSQDRRHLFVTPCIHITGNFLLSIYRESNVKQMNKSGKFK
jgi:hypothetical protein